jgi:hypothetical protein
MMPRSPFSDVTTRASVQPSDFSSGERYRLIGERSGYYELRHAGPMSRAHCGRPLSMPMAFFAPWARARQQDTR